MLFESFIFSWSEFNSLGSQSASEFLSGKVALTQDVVILEELLKTNTVFLDNLFDFHHKV